jgi:hypothetical protein
MNRWAIHDDVYLSRDSGATWKANGAIYGTGYGLWMTADLGNLDNGGTVHFDFVVDNFEETATLAMVSPPACTALLVAMGDVSGGGYTDLTQTPKSVLFSPGAQSNQGVDYAELAPTIVARTSDQAKTSGFYSTDGGTTWEPTGCASMTTSIGSEPCEPWLRTLSNTGRFTSRPMGAA